LLIGVRFADGQTITCAVFIDHLTMSEVKDAFFVPEDIDTVLGVARASNTDPDTSFVDVGLPEARAELQKALDQHRAMFPFAAESDTWPGCGALVQWLIRLMPAGDSTVPVLQQDPRRTMDLLQRFFASLVGMRFDDSHHRELLELCIEEGTGDPLRWSSARLKQLLDAAVAYPEDIPVELQLDLPELLRAFVPFAHAESGIRQELTTDALAAIDEAADGYRATVLDEAPYRGYYDDDGGSA
jgi:hypothetical protein